MKQPILSSIACCGALLMLAACDNADPSAAADTAGSKATASAAPAEFTGKTHEVKMTGTATSFFYEPKELTIKQGDKVKWVMGAAGPHNVNFGNTAFTEKSNVPSAAKPKLESMGVLATPLLQMAGQSSEIIFGKDLPTGEYNYVCDPHAPLGMVGKITVIP